MTMTEFRISPAPNEPAIPKLESVKSTPESEARKTAMAETITQIGKKLENEGLTVMDDKEVHKGWRDVYWFLSYGPDPKSKRVLNVEFSFKDDTDKPSIIMREQSRKRMEERRKLASVGIEHDESARHILDLPAELYSPSIVMELVRNELMHHEEPKELPLPKKTA